MSVLTVSPGTYRQIDPQNYALIPENTTVIRAPALDTAQSLSIRGWYPGFLANPDNYQSWIFGGYLAGRKHCRKSPPDLILSTFPIPSAHYLASRLQRLTGAPWVLDFRDPMAQDDYPEDPVRRRRLHQLERRFVDAANSILVTTPGTQRTYRERYSSFDPERIHLVPNGFDEALFGGDRSAAGKAGDRLTILHSGSLYKDERDPTQLFAALARVVAEQPEARRKMRFVFRGTRYADYFEGLARDHGVADIVEFPPAIDYQAAVDEMLAADGLLILQASNCNEQIPAKVYEYLRTGLPIIGLADPVGDTARLLSSCGLDSIAKLDDADAIVPLLTRFVAGNLDGFTASDAVDLEAFSRRRIASAVADILDEIVPPPD